MPNDVIVVDRVSKFYSTWTSPSSRLFHYLLTSLKSPRPVLDRFEKRHAKRFYALKDITLRVETGESIGIVGPNGSGKSTLLKIITDVLSPSEGTVSVMGKVTALLELGSGFNPDYTGLENIRFYASLLGISNEELERFTPEIISFADIGEFIHQPLKTYSSGMRMRLAFAVTTTLNPEILVIDEALAVGDEAFRRKCYARLDRLREQRITFLFVSHSEASVIQLCDRAVLLNHGKLIHDGPAKVTIAQYHALIDGPPRRRPQGASRSPRRTRREAKTDRETGLFNPEFLPKSTVSYPSDGAEIHLPALLDTNGEPVNQIYNGCSYRFCFNAHFTQTCRNVRFSMLLKTEKGFPLGGRVSDVARAGIPLVRAGDAFNIIFQFACNLAPGVYFLNAGVRGAFEEREIFLHRIVDACIFRVLPGENRTFTSYVDLKIESAFSPLGRLVEAE